MINKSKKHVNTKGWKLFCGCCGNNIPMIRENLTELIEKKTVYINFWNVDIGYSCPDCHNVTRMNLVFDKSNKELLKKIDLYNKK